MDSPTLAGATVTLTDAQAGDVLSVQGQSGSSGTLASGIGFSITGTTVTFSNVSSLANYQAALKLVQFNNTVVNPDTTDRTFSIQVDDGGGVNNLANATATVTVGSVNHAPQVTVPGTSVTVNEDGSLNLTGATATDVDSADTLTATISVGHGTLTSLALPSDLAQLTSATGNGTGLLTITGSVSAVNAVVTAGVTYAPAANYNGPDHLTLAVSDNHGGSDSKQVDITVTAVNDAPAGTDKTVTTNEDTAYTFTAADFGFSDANDSPANALLAVKITTLPGAGTLTDNNVTLTAGQSVSVADINGGLLKFTPAANANGNGYASFTFQVQDNGGTANGGVDLDPSANTITVNVTAVNDAPIVSGPVTLASIAEDSGPRTITQAELLSNASDVDGPSLSAINLAINTGNGTLTDNHDGTWSYSPAPNDDTSVTFSYSVTDGIAAPVATTANLDITPVNDAPVIDLVNLAGVQTSATTASFTENGGAVAVVPQLTLSDVDSPTLAGASVTLTDAQAGDVLSVQGQSGSSGTLASGIGFSITGTTVTFSNVSSLANYQAALKLVQFNNTVVNPDTTDRTFSIQVDDGGGVNNLANATATVTVGSVNHAPQVTVPGTSVTVNEDGSLNLTGATATDVDSADTLIATISVGHGTLTSLALPSDLAQLTSATGNGTGLLTITGSVSAVNAVVTAGVTYAPAANYNGPDHLTLAVSDNHGGSDSKQVDITVTAVNDAPAGTDKTVSTNEDTAYTFTAADFGFGDANDSPANALLAVKITTLPGAGTLTDKNVTLTAGQSVSVADINGGLLKFTPAANANGNGYASFTFQVQDNGGTANGGVDLDPSANTITVNVTAVNDAPTLTATAQ